MICLVLLPSKMFSLHFFKLIIKILYNLFCLLHHLYSSMVDKHYKSGQTCK